MHIDALIDHLAAMSRKHGNLKLVGDWGTVQEVRVTPCRDGVVSPMPEEGPNELHLELMQTEDN